MLQLMWDAWEWIKKGSSLLLPFKTLLLHLTKLVSEWWLAGKSQLEDESTTEVSHIKSLSEMPGPKPSLPLIGTTWIYWFGKFPLKKLHKANADKYMRYGKIMKEEFGYNCPMVQLFDPTDMEIVMKQQGRCPIRPANEPMAMFRRSHPEKYNSVGLVNAQGDEWFQLRSKLTPILIRQRTLQQYLPSMNLILDDFVALIRNLRSTKNTIDDTISMLYRLALENVLNVCLETRFGCLDPELKIDSEAQMMIRCAYNLFDAYQKLYFGPPLWKYMETEGYRQMADAENVAYEIATKYIDQAMEQAQELRASSCLDEKERGLTILSELIARDDIDSKDIRTIMVDFILAGIDTVATTVLFVLYQLARNPEAQEKLHSELETVLPFGAEVTNRTLANMPYLKACVKETFRLSPTIPNAIRVLPEDVVIQNYRVPAGTPICCHTMVSSRLPEYFDDPDFFIPERWIDNKSHHSLAVLPFGFGARMCIGHKLAEQEIYVMVSKIIQQFRLECDEDTMECDYRFMIIPEKPLAVRFIDR